VLVDRLKRWEKNPYLIGVQAIDHGIVGLVSQWQVDAEHFWTRGVTLIFYWQVSHCEGDCQRTRLSMVGGCLLFLAEGKRSDVPHNPHKKIHETRKLESIHEKHFYNVKI
jgi:hypothetical protein